jgi:hypothetical protein
VDPRRAELGYDYCLKEECQQRCLQRVELAAVGVNKAADYYMRADEVLPPPGPPAGPGAPVEPIDGDELEPPPPAGPQAPVEPIERDESEPPPRPGAPVGPVGADQPGPLRPPKPRPARRAPARPKSTLERLQEQEARLDEALDRSYQRFRLGEITAREMDLERDRLVEAFNRQVRSENIRYRSFLRRGRTRS